LVEGRTEELGADRFDWHDLDLLENIERAVELGAMSPSLVIDAELVFSALPSPERLRAELARRLAHADAMANPASLA
jgi:hypothetical protein